MESFIAYIWLQFPPQWLENLDNFQFCFLILGLRQLPQKQWALLCRVIITLSITERVKILVL